MAKGTNNSMPSRESRGYGRLVLCVLGAVAAVGIFMLAASAVCSLNTGAELPWGSILAALNF